MLLSGDISYLYFRFDQYFFVVEGVDKVQSKKRPLGVECEEGLALHIGRHEGGVRDGVQRQQVGPLAHSHQGALHSVAEVSVLKLHLCPIQGYREPPPMSLQVMG